MINGTYQWETNSSGYSSTYAYDPNGNITSLTRKNQAGTTFDNLTYDYQNPTTTNRLNFINDGITNDATVSYDLDKQATGNYLYDEIGNLTHDTKEGIDEIEWTASGKVSKVTKGTTEISFLYDGMGNRVRKFVSAGNKTTYYVRDASGNVMSTYYKGADNGNVIKQIEVPLYGSDRVGMAKPNITRNNNDNIAPTDETIFTRTLGLKMYELKDHLGNVRVVLGDKKTKNVNNHFVPDVVSYSNYYPFGMKMQENNGVTPSDTWQSPLYRYGYNGQEMDKDINSTGNITTAEFWEYDSRAARRWNTDPVKKYWQSDYVCFSDNPILRADPNGDDDYAIDKKGHISLTKKTDAKNHTIFNADGSKSTSVGLDFFQKKYEYSSGSGSVKKEHTIIVGSNIEDLKNAYKFFADNTNVEWQYSIYEKPYKFYPENSDVDQVENVYENYSIFGTLATSHSEGTILEHAELAYKILYMNRTRLLYTSHSHPGPYTPNTGHPAYPSGYTHQLEPIRKILAGKDVGMDDRGNYMYYKKNYSGRIPSMFNIYVVGKPQLQVEYDDEVVKRNIQLPTIIITPEAKKKK